MEKLCVLSIAFVLYVSCPHSSEAARFKHPLTVTDMRSFASPFNNGGYGSYVGAAGTPERYDMASRLASRPETYVESEVEEPVAAELKTAPQEQEYYSVYRRNANDPYARRLRRREKELNKLYEKIAREFPFLVQQGLYTPRGEKASLDHLLGMTIFGQPKMGRK